MHDIILWHYSIHVENNTNDELNLTVSKLNKWLSLQTSPREIEEQIQQTNV